MRKHIFMLLMAALTLISCGGSGGDDPTPSPTPTPDPTPTPTTKSHGLLVYCMGSGTGLQDEMDKNITRIVQAASSVIGDNSKICIFYDRVYDASNKNHDTYTRLTEVRKVDGRTKQVQIKEWVPSETSTVDPSFMTEVMKLARQTMGTDTYGLVLSSHGGGWVPSDTYDAFVAQESAANGSMEAKADLPKTKFFGEDSGEFMEVPTLSKALTDAGKWEYILFDACFMSSVEALYDLRTNADYIIASPAEVMSGGFPYDTIIPLLFGSTDHGLTDVCKAYMEAYKNSSATVALVQTSKLDALLSAAKPLYKAAASANINTASLQGYEGFSPHLFFDLAQYLQQSGATSAQLSAFSTALKAAVLYEGHTSTITSGCGSKAGKVAISTSCGLTCHVPVSGYDALHTAWLATDWGKAVQ